MAKHVIWKFELPVPEDIKNPVTSMEMPTGAKILDIQVQGNRPMVWAEMDPNAHMSTRRFMVLPTGQSFEPRGSQTYLGTFQIRASEFLSVVFHAFEIL